MCPRNRRCRMQSAGSARTILRKWVPAVPARQDQAGPAPERSRPPAMPGRGFWVPACSFLNCRLKSDAAGRRVSSARALGRGPRYDLHRRFHNDLHRRFHTEYLKFQTKQHGQYVNITSEVDAALKKSGIREGMILVSAMDITAGVWVNDAEDGLLADIDEWLEQLAPFRENYRHHRTGETNGDSHLKSLIVHHQVIVPVTDGRLDFGPWQQVYYAEFDGQRAKRVIIKAMGE